jgi:nitrogen fixation-related uncharacterized protein
MATLLQKSMTIYVYIVYISIFLFYLGVSKILSWDIDNKEFDFVSECLQRIV